MSFPHLQAAHTGASASAAMGTMNHLHTKQMGFQAAQRLQMARALGGGGAPPAPQAPLAPHAPQAPHGPNDWRQHAAVASGLPGVSVPEIHNAVGALAQVGQLNPIQAKALVAHKGPLQGTAGAQTVGKVAQAMKMIRARRAGAGGPPGVPQAPMQAPMMPPGGLPPGVGQ